MRDLVDDFKNGLIGIKLLHAKAEELREIEELVKLRWASGHHLDQQMSYTMKDETMYASREHRCVYQTHPNYRKHFAVIMTPAEFIDGCGKQNFSIAEEEMMKLFTPVKIK